MQEVAVKRYRLLAMVLVGFLVVGVASAQTLGDAARRNRNQKKQAAQKVFTNDDFASSAPLIRASVNEEEAAPVAQQSAEVPGQQPSASPEQAPAAPVQPAQSQSEPQPEAQAETPAEAEQKDNPVPAKAAAPSAAEWKSKVADQQKKIADLDREVNLMEREHQVKVAVYYADAGNQLRDSKAWFEQERKYEEDHTSKKKALEEAQQKLSDMKEHARKAGVRLGALE
jgi:hypothetical protein